MRCFHPRPAWRRADGSVTLDYRQSVPTGAFDGVRCGSCIGCRTTRAQHLVLRARLELMDHRDACWSTLTYDDGQVPMTLSVRHVQLYLKRLRKRVGKFRYIASGEYGDRTCRPHYHAIFFGLPQSEQAIVSEWRHGYARIDALTPASIAYVCGYVAKKIGHREAAKERVSSDGEVYQYQPPFLLVSRGGRKGHGIGGSARRFARSWRETAILDGYPVSVPRYLREGWKAAAGEAAVSVFHREMARLSAQFRLSHEELSDAEACALAKRARSEEERIL